MITIIIFLKKFIDKLYYSSYTLGERGALNRTMFPGINKVGEYNRLNGFLKTTSPAELDQLVGVIMAFYWGEVDRLTTKGKGDFQGIERYQGLVDFCQAIRDYSSELISLNQKP